MLDEKEQFDQTRIEQATEKSLDHILNSYLNLHDDCRTTVMTDANKNLINFVLNNIDKDKDPGRLVMPAHWKQKISHLHSTKFYLAK